MAKQQILIAEDDTLFAQDLQSRLESLDYEVCGNTRRANEAVALAQCLSPDLVLMDILLAGEMDGIQAAEQIRAFRLPVIYVTGCWDGPTLERAKGTEPCGYILKPFETAHLKVGIEMGLQRHRSLERERPREPECDGPAAAGPEGLNGLLSICCYCKNIKDDEGAWSQIEAYIMKRTKVSFTHGMCPECFGRVKAQLERLEKATSISMVIG